jgi:hypothetical protein
MFIYYTPSVEIEKTAAETAVRTLTIINYFSCMLIDESKMEVYVWRHDVLDSLWPFDEDEVAWLFQDFFEAEVEELLSRLEPIGINMYEMRERLALKFVYFFNDKCRAGDFIGDTEIFCHTFRKCGFSSAEVAIESNHTCSASMHVRIFYDFFYRTIRVFLQFIKRMYFHKI